MIKFSDGIKLFVFGLVLGLFVMYLLLIFVLKGADYYRGMNDGTFKLAHNIIISMAKGAK